MGEKINDFLILCSILQRKKNPLEENGHQRKHEETSVMLKAAFETLAALRSVCRVNDDGSDSHLSVKLLHNQMKVQ